MAWKRFPVPEFDYRPLKGRNFDPPDTISKAEEDRIVAAAEAGDISVAGAYAVEPDQDLLDRLKFAGKNRQMFLCVLPNGGHLMGRSMAWFNQRAKFLDKNSADGELLFEWSTPRTHNTRLGPEAGVDLERSHIYLLSGRILEDEDHGNLVMVDDQWTPGDNLDGYRVIAACDKDSKDFHDSCFMFSWAA